MYVIVLKLYLEESNTLLRGEMIKLDTRTPYMFADRSGSTLLINQFSSIGLADSEDTHRRYWRTDQSVSALLADYFGVNLLHEHVTSYNRDRICMFLVA